MSINRDVILNSPTGYSQSHTVYDPIYKQKRSAMIFIAAFVAVIYPFFSRNAVGVQTHRDNIVLDGPKTKIPEAGD